ncbi:myosin-10-like isoform X2 [Engraulis encrasicolus]|uniref:myosin-10-like isoform X2 n=1 Tax=Engraulis encrasicolus TaxID=184585 RepID=UPI002FD6B7BF
MAPASLNKAQELCKLINRYAEEQEEALKNAKEEREKDNTAILELSSKVRNLEHDNEKLKMELQERMVCVSEDNRAKMELTNGHNHKLQMELDMVTTWWQDADKQNTKLAKDANRLWSQKIDIQDLLEKEMNQNLILNLRIQQLQEERRKEKREDEEVIKDLQRQLTTLQRAMHALTAPQRSPAPSLKPSDVCMEMEEEERAESLQKEEEHADKLCPKMVTKTRQNLTISEKAPVYKLSPHYAGKTAVKSPVKQDKSLPMIPVLKELKKLKKHICTERIKPKRDINKIMTSEESTISERTDRTALMNTRDAVSKSKMEERVMTPMRCASWREVSGHAKVQNKAETMPKVHLNEVKAPSMIREKKQPESNRQPCTQRTDLKDLKGDMSKNKSTGEEHKKLLNYWNSRAVLVEMVDET